MSEPPVRYLPNAAERAAFMNKGPPAERLMRLEREMKALRERMGLAMDQQRILATVAGNVCQLMREGGVGDRLQLADLLDGCVEELGVLVQEQKP